MRLIDADILYDELKEVSKLKGTNDRGRKRARYIADFIDILGDASTIEAIPIEWLIKWNEDYAPRDYREMTEDMIADWREEQGDDVEG